MSQLSDKVYVFTGETFEAALEEWMARQIAAYPHKRDLIRTTALAMRDFMSSEEIRHHKMTVPAASGPIAPPCREGSES